MKLSLDIHIDIVIGVLFTECIFQTRISYRSWKVFNYFKHFCPCFNRGNFLILKKRIIEKKGTRKVEFKMKAL